MKRSLFEILSFSLIGLVALGLFACSEDEDTSEKPELGPACAYSYECEGDQEYCVEGHCLKPENTTRCNRQADCPDLLTQTCFNGRCLTLDCKENTDCNIAKIEVCDDNNKCIPDCLNDTDCVNKNGEGWRCTSRVCEYQSTDGDLDVQDVEEDAPYVDPCNNTSLGSCTDYQANSCLGDVLGCNDFAGRDYTYCYNYYGNSETAVGRTIYFAGGDYWREFFGSTTYEAGNADGFCYFLKPGRMQNEGEYTDAQGTHQGYLFAGASHIRIECGDTVECYSATDLMNCDGFPFPPFAFIPKEDHPLTCTDDPNAR